MTRLAGLPGLIFALLLTLVWAPAHAQNQATAGPKFPELTGRVVDDAHVLSPQTQADLTLKLAALEQKNSRQLVVVTLPSLGGDEIEDYGNLLLRHWGIGQKGLNNGALFIIVPSEHKMRIEVGYGLEGTLTDAMSRVILDRAVVPKFRAGDLQGGIVDGTNAIIEQMGLDPSTAEARVAAAAEQAPRHAHRNPVGGAIALLIMFFVLTTIFRGRGRGGSGVGSGWALPLMFLGGAASGGGWGGGGSDDSDSGGGDDFSGGGGSGGGGGASDSW
jgi:uncharacterized protein